MLNLSRNYDYQTLIAYIENDITKYLLAYTINVDEPKLFFEYSPDKRKTFPVYYLTSKLTYLFLLEDDMYYGDRIKKQEHFLDGMYYIAKSEYFKFSFRKDKPLVIERSKLGNSASCEKSGSSKIYYIDEGSRIASVYSLAEEFKGGVEILSDYKNINESYFEFTDDFFEELCNIDIFEFCNDNIDKVEEVLLAYISNKYYILDFDVEAKKAGVI